MGDPDRLAYNPNPKHGRDPGHPPIQVTLTSSINNTFERVQLGKPTYGMYPKNIKPECIYLPIQPKPRPCRFIVHNATRTYEIHGTFPFQQNTSTTRCKLPESGTMTRDGSPPPILASAPRDASAYSKARARGRGREPPMSHFIRPPAPTRSCTSTRSCRPRVRQG